MNTINSTIVIEDNVPMPSAETLRSRNRETVPSPYPFDKLTVGQSFREPNVKNFRTVLAHYSYFRKSNKDKVMLVKRVADGVRVWRTK